MGDWGKLALSDYTSQHLRAGTGQNAEKLETEVAAWLANEKPGSFTSRGPCGCYDRALAQFSQWSGRQDVRDDFEIALARIGYRAGTLVFDGEPRWLLILPSSVDTALTRLADMEIRPERETA